MDIIVLITLIGSILSLGIGAWYFLKAPRHASLMLRVATAAYAPSTTLLFVLAFVIPRDTWISLGDSAILIVQIIPMLLMILSLFAYPGRKTLHIFLIPLALFFWLFQFFIARIVAYGL